MQYFIAILHKIFARLKEMLKGERVDRIVDCYASQMPLIVTTNAKNRELPARVASRLSDKRCSIVCQIDAEDYRREKVSYEPYV